MTKDSRSLGAAALPGEAMRMFMGGKKGAVGIGTLIIFIAMVLVAAIAAAVLINVSGILQQRAMATGKESIQQVSSNLVVVSINGLTNTARTNVENVSLAITAAAGAGRIDMKYTILQIGNGVNQTYLNYSASTMGVGTYVASKIRDPSNLFTIDTPVIDGSSLIRLQFSAIDQTNIIYYPPRQQYKFVLIPEHGASVTISGIMPEAYSSDNIDIYP
ncbi:MAG: archaellin/type IV pilin N-terminal domain-containing protein [Candidatus Micrarchaeota archaeon]